MGEPRSILERVLAVLELFTEDRVEWTPEEMMEALGYSRPTLYRYLKTLKDAGLLTSLLSKGYTLGPKVVEMDYLVRKSDTLVLHSQPFLDALIAKYPCTALLVRLYGNKILCVASECSTPDPLSSYPRGRPMPLSRGAISRAILAFTPRRLLIPMIERNIEELRAVRLGETSDEIYESLRKVKRAGYAIAYGEVTPGVVGIAAPLFDATKTPIASICITIAGNQITGNLTAAIGRDIRIAAEQISQKLACARTGDHNFKTLTPAIQEV